MRSDTLFVQAVNYYENFLQHVRNGNAPNDTPCDDDSSLLCNESGISAMLSHCSHDHRKVI
jgi:hypothetical protein